MNKLKKTDRVKIKGTDTTATVTKVSRDGLVHIRLDYPAGTSLRIHQSALVPVQASSNSSQLPEPDDGTSPSTPSSSGMSLSCSSSQQDSASTQPSVAEATQPRQPNGQFAVGGTHPYYPPRPENMERVATARSLRRSLMQGMAQLVDELPGLIARIEEPDKEVAAINNTLRIILPQYSSIKFTDAPPRSLTAEQSLADLKKRFEDQHR